MKNENTTAPQSYATAEEAFDAALDNIGTFIKNGIRRAQNYGDADGPPGAGADGVGQKFKLYIDYRDNQPHPVQFNLRYDYPVLPPPNPGGDFETNDIFWRLRQE
jgi:hypothetical protein